MNPQAGSLPAPEEKSGEPISLPAQQLPIPSPVTQVPPGNVNPARGTGGDSIGGAVSGAVSGATGFAPLSHPVSGGIPVPIQPPSVSGTVPGAGPGGTAADGPWGQAAFSYGGLPVRPFLDPNQEVKYPPGVFPPDQAPGYPSRRVPANNVSYQEMAGVKRGLQFCYYSLVTLLATIALGVGLFIFAIVTSFPIGLGFGLLFSLCGWIVGAFFLIASFSGKLFCFSVPVRSGARGVLKAATLLEGIAILATLLGWFAFVLAIPFYFLGSVCFAAGFLCFLVFLKRIGKFMGSEKVRRSANTLLVMFSVVRGIGLVSAIGSLVSFFVGFFLLAPLGCIGLAIPIAFVVGLCMYSTLLRNAIRAIAELGASGAPAVAPATQV